MTETSDYLSVLASFVPDLVLREANDGKGRPNRESLEIFEAIVLFIDVAGFTALTEKLAENKSGAEDLTELLNIYLGKLIDISVDHGGDIVKFAGDALIVLWPKDNVNTIEDQFNTAIQCAMKIRNNLSDYEVAKGFQMRVKLALSAGDVWVERLGGVFDRWELLIAGDALGQIGSAADHANPGDVIVSPQARVLADGSLEGKELPGNNLQVTDIFIKNKADQNYIRPRPIALAADLIRGFIPAAIKDRLNAGSIEWVCELRRVSVLFINLPDLGVETPLNEAQNAMRAAQMEIYRFEGSINKMSVDEKGASLIAVYGLPPLYHRDDPDRATMAAMAVRDRLARVGQKAWIGVTTGQAFCGIVGNQTRREYTVMGDVVNLAARLMTVAKGGKTGKPIDGKVLCCHTTSNEARTSIEFEQIPSVYVKGKAKKVSIFRPLFQKLKEYEEAVISKKYNIVGRDKEIKEINKSIYQYLTMNSSEKIVIYGDRGSGKSRILQESIRLIKEIGIFPALGVGEPIERNTPFFVWRRIFTELFAKCGIESLIDDKIQSKILSVFGSNEKILRYIPLINNLFPMNWEENEYTKNLSGKARLEETINLLSNIIQNVNNKHKIIILLKDIQNIDLSSFDLINKISGKDFNITLILTSKMKTEGNNDLIQKIETLGKHKEINLNPLNLTDLENICSNKFGLIGIPRNIMKFLIERGGRNPLFTLEIFQSLLESGYLNIESKKIVIYKEAYNFEDWKIPQSIEGVVAERIDRLPQRKQMTMGVASVIGRVFSAEELSSIHPSGCNLDELKEQCDWLAEVGMTPPVKSNSLLIADQVSISNWKFDSNLLKDVTYNRMLFVQRRELHKNMAEYLEKNIDIHEKSLAPQLAHHWRYAAEGRVLNNYAALKAAKYYGIAASQAMQIHAVTDAIKLWEIGISLLTELDASKEKDALELKFLLDKGSAQITAGSFSAPEVETSFKRAKRLCDTSGEYKEIFRAQRGLWQVGVGRGEYDFALVQADALVSIAQSVNDATIELEAWRCKGTTEFWLGNFVESKAAMELTCKLYDPREHSDLWQVFGQDPFVATKGLYAWALVHLGDLQKGKYQAAIAEKRANEINHPFSIAYAKGARMWTGYFANDKKLAVKASTECIQISLERSFPYLTAAGHVVHGWATGDLNEINDAIEDWGKVGGGIGLAPFQLAHAEAHLASHNDEKAIEILKNAGLKKKIESEIWLQSIHKMILGSALIKSGQIQKGEGYINILKNNVIYSNITRPFGRKYI